jgi:hypothetical protein
MPPEKERKKPFECEFCESSFALKHQLRKHVSTVHEEILSHLFDRIKPHCSYLDIYISQKIRLFKGYFEGKFQTSIQASSIMIFLI